MTPEEKEQIMAARGQSKVEVKGTKKYVAHLGNGQSVICIDLVNDTPEQVISGIRSIFGKYGILRIEY